MILHDEITVIRRIYVGRDSRGNAIYEDAPVAYRAEVRPLSSQENLASGGSTVTTRHRVFLDPTADVVATEAITWRGVAYQVDGDLEPHALGGRLHHQEAIIKRQGTPG